MHSQTVTTAKARTASSLRVEGLHKSFGGLKVVDDVSFDLAGGQLLTLLGPSGCGKTTTMRAIAGFELPDSGSIEVAGQNVSGVPAHKRDIGVVFQQYALFPHLSVFRNVAYPLEMRRRPAAEIAARVERALAMVRLVGFEDRYPRQLSGGQQQRVALARAIVFEPRLLLMDEPLGALDKRLRETMQVEIRGLQREIGITTVLVTHDQAEALLMSDLVAVMNDGALQQVGPPLEVYHRPANRFVADFVGETNLLTGTMGHDANGAPSLTSSGGLVTGVTVPKPRHPVGAVASVVIRPEKIAIGVAAAGCLSRHRAELREVLNLGDIVKYRVITSSGEELTIKTLAGRLSHSVGEQIEIGWDTDDCVAVRS